MRLTMLYEVECFISSERGGTSHYKTTLKANDRKEIPSLLKKKLRGYIIHDVVIHEIQNEPDDAFIPREKCDRCGVPLNDGGTCPVCDDGEEDYYGNLTEGKKDEVSVEEFWEMVCCGKDKQVFEICRKDRNPKGFYHRFGSDHSYIMGAIRNGNWSTAKILMTFGVEFTPQDARELALLLMQAKGE